MNEDEWLTSPDYVELVRQLVCDHDPSARKLYLLGCACARLAPQLLTVARIRQLIMAVERYADGMISLGTLELFVNQAAQVIEEENYWGSRVAYWITGLAPSDAILESPRWARYTVPNNDVELKGQLDRLHDIFGNPFQPVVMKPNWLNHDVVRLAEDVYDNIPNIECEECGGHGGFEGPIWTRCRVGCHKGKLIGHCFDFTRMSILADALEDVGCDNEDVINHLRSPKAHVRGCWVIDSILGKS